MPDVTLYMPLLDEGVDVWRPVQAERLTADRYRILGTVPDGETWLFEPNAVVRCERRPLQSGERLVPVEIVKQ